MRFCHLTVIVLETRGIKNDNEKLSHLCLRVARLSCTSRENKINNRGAYGGEGGRERRDTQFYVLGGVGSHLGIMLPPTAAYCHRSTAFQKGDPVRPPLISDTLQVRAPDSIAAHADHFLFASCLPAASVFVQTLQTLVAQRCLVTA
jgi:hypothetical protein